MCFFVFSSVFSDECPPITEENALAKWASDPANTAWMESKIGDLNAPLNLKEKMSLVSVVYSPVHRKTAFGAVPRCFLLCSFEEAGTARASLLKHCFPFVA